MARKARTAEERERLKEWALSWRPQPTHNRLNRYQKIKFGNYADYHKGRVVLCLSPAEREKAEAIYDYLLEKHRWKVRSRPGYCRMLWACAVSRCRKSLPQRYERLSIVNKLTYWHDLAHEEGVARLGIPSLKLRRSRLTEIPSEKSSSPSRESLSAKRRELDKLLADLESSFR